MKTSIKFIITKITQKPQQNSASACKMPVYGLSQDSGTVNFAVNLNRRCNNRIIGHIGPTIQRKSCHGTIAALTVLNDNCFRTPWQMSLF